LAGPAFSVLAGIVLLVPLYMIVGIERTTNVPTVPSVKAGSPADRGGIKAGDRITAIDGKPISTFTDLLTMVHQAPDRPMQFVVDRKGKSLALQVKPEISKTDMLVLDEHLSPTGEWRRQPMVGIGIPNDQHFEVLGLMDATEAALNEPVRAVRSMLSLATRPKNFENTVSGPATMVALTDYALKKGFATLVNLGALLSISVGIFNLLPFAPLDGGQMVVALVELIRGGKRLSIQVQTAINGVGLTLIALLVLGAWFFDFKRWLVPDQPAVTPVTSQPAMPTPKR
jgi:regulator of sigma E protease